jgi:hypothetical protein
MGELIEPGLTGEVVADEDRAVAAVAAVGALDRRAIRARAVERFGHGRMVDAYLAVYAQILGAVPEVPSSKGV